MFRAYFAAVAVTVSIAVHLVCAAGFGCVAGLLG